MSWASLLQLRECLKNKLLLVLLLPPLLLTPLWGNEGVGYWRWSEAGSRRLSLRLSLSDLCARSSSSQPEAQVTWKVSLHSSAVLLPAHGLDPPLSPSHPPQPYVYMCIPPPEMMVMVCGQERARQLEEEAGSHSEAVASSFWDY